MAKQYHPLLLTFLAALAFYVINKLLFLLPDAATHYDTYTYSVETLFLFFTACSLIVVLILIKVHQKLPDSAGYAFISATTVKMGICYFMMRPILKSAPANGNFEKINFFVLFLLFLAIETAVTVRLLNKKQ
jgi:hypothetical protein